MRDEKKPVYIYVIFTVSLFVKGGEDLSVMSETEIIVKFSLILGGLYHLMIFII